MKPATNPGPRRAARDARVFVNGRVLTCDPALPEADWCVVGGGIVRQVGRGAAPAGLPQLDLAGRTLIPGFCDAHVHLSWLALSFLGPDLKDATSSDEVVERVRAWGGDGRGPGGRWIVGDGFDETTWARKELPTRNELDAAAADRPVLVKRVCGHVGVLNGAGIAALGPAVGRGFTDQQTGRIAETDLWDLNDQLRPRAAQFVSVLPQSFDVLLSHGITAIHDVASLALIDALEPLRRSSALPLRISYSIPAAHLNAALERAPSRDAWLRFLGVKVFADGSLGARTACLRAPYTDAPATHGALLHDPEALRALVRRVDAAGLQLMVHAIGDAALDAVLNALGPLCREGNPRRHRLEHVEVTPPDLVQRLAKSGLWTCMQPNFAARWSKPGGMNEQRLGERLEHCNAYASVHDAGVPLAFGSDCMPLGPLFGLSGATQHPVVAERLSGALALEFYTRTASELLFAEHIHGAIRPGLAADLVLLRGDPTSTEPAQVVVDTVFVAGERVWVRRPPVVDWGPGTC